MIRRANSDDSQVLSALAQRVFVETFKGDPDHKPHDLAMHLSGALGVETLAREVSDPQTPYYVVEDAEKPERPMIAYLKLSHGHAPACVVGTRPLEIARLYVEFAYHRTGVAHALMQRAVEHAAAGGFETLWLGVWHRNIRAQRFYRKWRFEHVGEHPYIFGTDHQVDWVFSRPLTMRD